MGAVLKLQGKEYDVEKDFTWGELLLVEELAGVPLGQAGAFDSMGVVGAFVFVIKKRDEPTLTWEQFVQSPVELPGDDEVKPRPTRAKAKTA